MYTGRFKIGIIPLGEWDVLEVRKYSKKLLLLKTEIF